VSPTLASLARVLSHDHNDANVGIVRLDAHALGFGAFFFRPENAAGAINLHLLSVLSVLSVSSVSSFPISPTVCLSGCPTLRI
jgi:hypothetical protein